MVSQKITVKNMTGFHLRPAGILCKIAMNYKSKVQFQFNSVTEDNSIEEMKMDEYLLGVVSAEMPADFEEEALKAVIAGIENGLGE